MAAFRPPFCTAYVGDYTIPEKYETRLLDVYAEMTGPGEDAIDASIANSDPDLHFSALPSAIEALGVPPEVITGLRPADWCISGTDIVDFDKWLYNGYFWLLLGLNVETVDALWLQFAHTMDRTSGVSRKQLASMVKELRLDLDVDSMFKLASGATASTISYVNLYTILGRLALIPI